MAGRSRGWSRLAAAAFSVRRSRPPALVPAPGWSRGGRSVPDRSTVTACMSAEGARFTLDTNLLVYSLDSAAGARHEVALEIVDRAVQSDCWLTLQALSEFHAAVTRKGIVSPAEAAEQVVDWLELFPTVAASAAAIR